MKNFDEEATKMFFIRNTKNEDIMPVEAYDKGRPHAAMDHFHTLCHAPFVSMDFGPQGQINVCNHYHQKLGNISEIDSILSFWMGAKYQKLRTCMQSFMINEDLCRHCARQIRTGNPKNAFSREQYDNRPAETATPPYPSMLTFRMSNTCNLACIMCTGNLSSRIRRERENRPNPPSVYGEPFFEEIRQILPYVKHIEFFGGEPFLVKEHLRIFDLIRETGAQSSIYVNTNAMSLTDRVKGYLEDLNFTCIAISMDALNPKVLSRIRIGIKADRFFQNLKWYFELRNRKPVHVLLNVTELRQNWFELPEMFRFAADMDCSLHINTCIHPTYCTLYDLPTDQLNYVFHFLQQSKDTLSNALKVRGNERSYDHLLGMIRTELEKRTPNTPQPECARLDPSIYGTDGLLAAPLIGFGQFATPEQVLAEVNRLKPFVSGFGDRLLWELQAQAHAVSGTVKWHRVEQVIASLRKPSHPSRRN